ncbi:MAG: AAA family ATPase [Sulfurimonas sp.]|uniref:ATP-binding protein n=1 Tax=Sulfurimonas sp. TaxID=2022749 RepID=UPI00260824AF|nr:ATP-binding protein [Sulfurimonas sp.]MDD2652712.1 AAA family ATPase [Sulfurimonas sp.]MDD3450654.1 AAA family ATPase [Sulfurimonas sp.]
MKLKKLPIGISTLKTIMEEGYLYVDKTELAQHLIENGQYYFLSRPRRFGKSLFLDTLRTVFSGDKEVFKGLYIGESGYEFRKHPVVRISFASGKFTSKDEFNQRIYEILKSNQQDLGIVCDKDLSSSGCFEQLIKEAYLKYNQKVVILVDEYDKPILDNIENTEIARLMREELKNFYSVIKGSDEYLKFVFITGVSKFSKVSLFSGLNNILDITLNPKYATICGYTQNDVETVFAKHLNGQDFVKIRHWYNGYKFLGEGVYNPFDILLFISNEFIYRNYWFSTATPTFLLKLIEKNDYFLPDFENITKDESMLDSFDVDYIELETLMWQTGYLTIIDSKETPIGMKYSLSIPNQEVKISLFGSISDFMSKIQNSMENKGFIYESFLNLDFKRLGTSIKSLFASIPYHLYTNNPMFEREGYYVSVFYAYVKSMGLELRVEETTNKGRIDMVVFYPNAIFVMEFKVIASETKQSTALSQIKSMNYHEKYLSDTRGIYLVGLEFSKSDKNIYKLEWEKVQK